MSCCIRPCESASSTAPCSLLSQWATDARMDPLSGIHAAGCCAAPMTAGLCKTLCRHSFTKVRSWVLLGRYRTPSPGAVMVVPLPCTPPRAGYPVVDSCLALAVAWLGTVHELLVSTRLSSLMLQGSTRSQPPAWSGLLPARLVPGCAFGVPEVVACSQRCAGRPPWLQHLWSSLLFTSKGDVLRRLTVMSERACRG
jgi:hypothetical protein